MVNIIAVDFAGTLIKPEIIEEANRFRAAVLERALPTLDEHANPDELYRNNREFVRKITGLKDDMLLRYRRNSGKTTTLSGEDFQNQIATTFFQIGMYAVTKKHGMNIYPKNMIEQLRRIKGCGFDLAIVSGVRTDIISGMLVISGLDFRFDFIYGQPPILGISNEKNMKDLAKYASIAYVIGDKLSDLESGPEVGAKTIFAKWGHASGGEEEFADYTIEKPEELEGIIK